MIPTNNILTEELTEITIPSKTYKIAVNFLDADSMEGTQVFYNQTLSFNSKQLLLLNSTLQIKVEVGVEYDVSWNGVVYTCMVYEDAGEIYLGNGNLISSSWIGSKEPFCFSGYTGKLTMATKSTNSAEKIVVKIQEHVDAYDRINGYIDGLDAIKQAIYLILNTERYQFIIYSWNYGIELLDLFGQPMSYVIAEIPRRVTEALTQDDRILDVTDFTFEKTGTNLHTTFTVVTELGDISTDLEVSV
jgi:phage baseplate assembly protein W